jgi:hypothetical protein
MQTVTNVECDAAQPCLPRLADFPAQPVVFVLATRLVLTIREPFRSEVRRLLPGQPLRLRRDCGNPQSSQAIRVETADGCAVGYLSADVACYLAILLDHLPTLADSSTATCIQLAAPPDDPAARRLRYPKLDIQIRLTLADGWPLFVIAAVLGLKTEDYASRFNLAGNVWLSPIRLFHDDYQRLGHDRFCLPAPLVDAWFWLTRGGEHAGNRGEDIRSDEQERQAVE